MKKEDEKKKTLVSYNILSWKGPTQIIKSNSWLHTGPPPLSLSHKRKKKKIENIQTQIVTFLYFALPTQCVSSVLLSNNTYKEFLQR